MALQGFTNGLGAFVSPLGPYWYTDITAGSSTINATGEQAGAVGRIIIPGGGSKTISSSGGKIHWTTNAITWANAGTSLRFGIQDVDGATGLPDLTFDVFADLVPGTETITANSMNTHTMESGSKTITHGDIIAVFWEMTTRAGTDSVTVRNTSSAARNFGYAVANTGGGLVKITTYPFSATIEFDDGTVGFFAGTHAMPVTSGVSGGTWGTLVSINSGSTPDEVAMIFSLPFPAKLSTVVVPLINKDVADTLEVILYADPLGSPSPLVTLVGNVVFGSNTGANASFFTPDQTTLAANTVYGLAIRPTSTNPFDYYEYIFGSQTNAMKATALGTNWYKGTRTDQTGAFSTTTSTIPNISFFLSAFDDGVSTGFVGIIGGV